VFAAGLRCGEPIEKSFEDVLGHDLIGGRADPAHLGVVDLVALGAVTRVVVSIGGSWAASRAQAHAVYRSRRSQEVFVIRGRSGATAV
jgi:hypothetical protein